MTKSVFAAVMLQTALTAVLPHILLRLTSMRQSLLAGGNEETESMLRFCFLKSNVYVLTLHSLCAAWHEHMW